MEKKEITLKDAVPKKNSVCYKTSDKDAAVRSIYLMRSAFSGPAPRAIKVTIEEVS